jgi:hypothetical protein
MLSTRVGAFFFLACWRAVVACHPQVRCFTSFPLRSPEDSVTGGAGRVPRLVPSVPTLRARTGCLRACPAPNLPWLPLPKPVLLAPSQKTLLPLFGVGSGAKGWKAQVSEFERMISGGFSM